MTFSEICGQVFQLFATLRIGQDRTATATRRVHLMSTMLQTVCSSGRPVLLALEGLHSEQILVSQLIHNCSRSFRTGDRRCKQGVLVVWAYETDEHVLIMNKIEKDVASIQELGKDDLAKLLSCQLNLPAYCTNANRLAEIVYRKTRGSKEEVVKFLKSIIKGKLLSYDVATCHWVWDVTLIEKQRIGNAVAKLMVEAFDQLSTSMMKTLQIVSCLGSHIAASTLSALNSGDVLPFDMRQEIRQAVKEGLLDEAYGISYSFSHITIKEALYNRIQESNRKLLHKTIGENLLKVADAGDTTIHLSATDQLNIWSKDEDLSSEERSKYVYMNVNAAKLAINAGNLTQGELLSALHQI